MAEKMAATFKMASAGHEAMKRLRSLSECCICLTTYRDPRMLPCFHTACLKCFEDIQLKNGKRPGDVLQCPLCRNEFLIPSDGMKGLQINFFIENLIEVTNTFKLNIENKSRPCEMCSVDEEAKDVTQATMRCLNCCENYCLRCSKIHQTLKATKDHKIIELNIEVNGEEIINMFPIRKCVRHSDIELDYYCSDCKTVVCVSCFVEERQTHKCKEVTTVDKEFRQRIEQSFKEMYDHKEDILSRKSDWERKKRDFLAKVLETESVNRTKNKQLKALIDQHTEELLYELPLLKRRQENQMDAEIEEIERKLAVHESFVTYCTELKSKGSPSEVCDSVDRLLARAKELNKEYDEFLRSPSKSLDLEFIATDHNVRLQNAGNIIGKLSEPAKEFNSYAFVFTNFQDAIKINLNRQEDVTVLDPLPAHFKWGTAAAVVYRKSLFMCGLGNKFEEIWKLDSTSWKWRKCTSLIRGRRYHSVAFVNDVLYICGGWLNYPGKAIDDVETYNTYDDRCSKVGKLAYAISSSGNCVPFQTALYIFGGYDVRNKTASTVQVYNTKLNTCTLLTKQMPSACHWLRGELWSNYVILLGKDGCFIYNFETETWKVRDKFKLENMHSGVFVNDDKLFVVGCGAKKDGVRWIPVANIMNDELIEWRHHAKLSKNYFANISAFGKLDCPL